MSRYKTKDGWIKQRHNPLVIIAKYIGLPLLVCFMFISFAIGVNVQLKKYFDYQEQKRIEKQQKLEHEKWEQIEKEQEQKRQEYRERVKREQEEQKKKDIGEANYNKNTALWNMIKEQYPKGTYVLNKATMQKGRIIDYQGERIFTDCDWYFDFGEDIEIIGYKEYRQYVKLIKKIK